MLLRALLALALVSTAAPALTAAQARPRARDLGIPIGGTPGPLDAITDVTGVEVGHTTLVAGIELEPRADRPAARAFEVFLDCFEQGLLIRTTCDIIALSPPLIVERAHIDQMFSTLEGALKRVG